MPVVVTCHDTCVQYMIRVSLPKARTLRSTQSPRRRERTQKGRVPGPTTPAAVKRHNFSHLARSRRLVPHTTRSPPAASATGSPPTGPRTAAAHTSLPRPTAQPHPPCPQSLCSLISVCLAPPPSRLRLRSSALHIIRSPNITLRRASREPPREESSESYLR